MHPLFLNVFMYVGICLILLIVCLILGVAVILSPLIELIVSFVQTSIPYSTSGKTLREIELRAANEFLHGRDIQFEVIDSQTYNKRSKSILGIHMLKFSRKSMDSGSTEMTGTKSTEMTGTTKSTEMTKSTGNILIVHGANSGPVYFFDIVPPLIEQGKDVYCLSLPGFGVAAMDSHVFDYNSQEISEVMDEYLFAITEIYFEENKPALIGHSFGGFICSHFAIKYPDRIDQLILVNAAGIFPTLDSWGMYWAVLFKLGIPNRIARQVGRSLNPILYSFVDMESDRAWQSIWSLAQMTCRENYGDRLVSEFITYHFDHAYWNIANSPGLLAIKQKICMIWGHDDTISPLHSAILFAALHNNPVSIYVVKNGGHNPIYVNGGQNVAYILKSIFPSNGIDTLEEGNIKAIEENQGSEEDQGTEENQGTEETQVADDHQVTEDSKYMYALFQEFGKSTFSLSETISNIDNLYRNLTCRHSECKLNLKIANVDSHEDFSVENIRSYYDLSTLLQF
jgi:pimeloyl-ACP methyl ester carboxylesterase